MRTIAPFNPTTSTGGTIQVNVVNRCATVILYNESNIGILLTFTDGDTAFLPAWWARSYKLRTAGIAAIDWQQAYILDSASSPISQIYGEAYEASEAVQDVNVALGRQTNIGNSINTVANMIATNIVNTGNPSTNIVEATLSGSSGTNMLMKNDGTVAIKEFVSSVLTALVEIIPGASTPVKLAALGRTLQILGSTLINQNLTVTGNLSVAGSATLPTVTGGVDFEGGTLSDIGQIRFSTTPTIKIVNGAGVTLFSHDGGDVDWNVPVGVGNQFHIQMNGVDKFRLDQSGNLIIAGSLTQNGNP